MTGWDTYEHGHGRMRGTVLGVPVVDGHGATFDTSEQVTWLNDAVLMAPSMLLHPAVRWSDGADPNSFVLDFTDAGRTVRAEVRTDERGAPLTFATDDRYADLPGGLVRARWSTPVEGWTVRSGRPCLTRGQRGVAAAGRPVPLRHAHADGRDRQAGLGLTASGGSEGIASACRFSRGWAEPRPVASPSPPCICTSGRNAGPGCGS